MESSKNSQDGGISGCNSEVKLYRARWFLLALFMLFTSNSAIHWLQFVSMTDLVSRYYDVRLTFVEWTSTMVTGAQNVLLVPALFLMDKLETKRTLILASSLCLIGSFVKACSIAPNIFHIAMIGQLFCALSSVFTYGLIGKFTAAWFSVDEMSRAGALIFVGETLGAAFSILLPLLFVTDDEHTTKIDIEEEFGYLNYFYTAWTFVTLISITLFFKSEPERPPSAAQAHARTRRSKEVLKSVRELLGNRNFFLFVVSQSIVFGCGSNAVETRLKEMIDANFTKGYAAQTGAIRLANMLGGVVGSVVLSCIQDRSQKYKCNAVTLSVAICIGLACFTASLKQGSILYVYITYGIYGFLTRGYYVTTIQMGIELSFPVPAGITVATTWVCVESIAMISTFVYGLAMERYGDLRSNLALVFLLFLSTVLVSQVPPEFKRKEFERVAKSADELRELFNHSGKKRMVPSTAYSTDV